MEPLWRTEDGDVFNDGLGHDKPMCEMRYFSDCFTSAWDRTLSNHCKLLPLMNGFRKVANEFSRLARTGHGDTTCLYSVQRMACEKMKFFGITETIPFFAKFQSLASQIFETCGKDGLREKYQPVMDEIGELIRSDCQKKTTPAPRPEETTELTTTTSQTFWFVNMTTLNVTLPVI